MTDICVCNFVTVIPILVLVLSPRPAHPLTERMYLGGELKHNADDSTRYALTSSMYMIDNR
jgi:hypothetical protein